MDYRIRLALQNPMRFGVFDTQGNLHEWIWERFGEFESNEATDPISYEIPIPSLYTRPIKGVPLPVPKLVSNPTTDPTHLRL